MTMSELKSYLVEKITASQGCKAGELVVDKFLVIDHEFWEVSQALEELVQDGEIIEVEYVLPNMDYRCKSMYFPKGTKIEVDKNRLSA